MDSKQDEDSSRTLLDRADDWDGDLDSLVGICVELSGDFDSMVTEHDERNIRAVCKALLGHPDLPALYSAQFLVYVAVTEDEDDVNSMKYHLHAAEQAIAEAFCPMSHSHSYHCDEKVDRLSSSIQRMLGHVDAAIHDNNPASPTFAVVQEASKGEAHVVSDEHGSRTQVLPMSETEEKEKAEEFLKKVEALQLESAGGTLRRRPKVPPSLRIKTGNQAFLTPGPKSGITPTQAIVRKPETRRKISSIFGPAKSHDKEGA